MSGDAGDSIARNTAFSLVAYATTSLFTAGLTIFLIRALDPHGFGVFALALSIGTLLLVPSDFGISQATARFIAERRRDRGAVAVVIGEALRLKLLLSTLLSALLAALAGPIASAYGDHALTWPIRGMALAVLAQSVMLFFSFAFIAQARVRLNVQLVFLESLAEASASIALVLLGGGAAGAAFGRAIGYAAGAAFGVILTTRVVGAGVLRRRGVSREWVTRISRYAGALLIVDGAYTLFGQIDALLLGAFLTVSAVGIFRAPLRLIAFLQWPGIALGNSVAPRLARGEGTEPNVGAFVAAVRYAIAFQAALVAPVLVWPHAIASLALGHGYAKSGDVLRALAPYVFLSGLAPLLSTAVNYLGEARRRIPLALGTVAVNAIVDVILIPRIGVVAGAIGTDVAFLLYVPGHLWVCTRLLDLPLRRLALTLLRSTLAAGAMAAVLLAFGTHDLPALAWVVGSIGGVTAYAVVLLATGELTPSERRRARDLVGRVRFRRPRNA